MIPGRFQKREQWLQVQGCYSKEQAGKGASNKELERDLLQSKSALNSNCHGKKLGDLLVSSPDTLPFYILETRTRKDF